MPLLLQRWRFSYVSQNFLESKFITEHELRELLRAAEEEGATVFWIYLSSCLYEQTEIQKYQAAHNLHAH